MRGRGNLKPQPSIQSRLGTPGQMGGVSIKSRLGAQGRGSGALRPGVTRAGTATNASAIMKSPITDARQKINLNRVKSGRIVDARQNIELKRTNHFGLVVPAGAGVAVSTMRSIGRGSHRGRGGGRVSSNVAVGFVSPMKTLKITTVNSIGDASSAGLFRNAVSAMSSSQWPYARAPPSPPLQSLMLTRTVRNPQANYPQAGLTSSYSRMTTGSSGMYSTSAGKSALTKMGSRSQTQVRATIQNHYMRSDDEDEDDDMEMEEEPSPPPVLRSSLKARLDTPPKYKVKVSNLQPSVTTDDIMELFADVGDLISARVLDSGVAEAFYRTKSDCHKAIEAYHNRLLDGSPMKVVMGEDSQGTSGGEKSSSTKKGIPTLRSAGGATMKIPKSVPNPNVKIHPDISAIHKVLFQPSSSSNSTKMLFNKTS